MARPARPAALQHSLGIRQGWSAGQQRQAGGQHAGGRMCSRWRAAWLRHGKHAWQLVCTARAAGTETAPGGGSSRPAPGGDQLVLLWAPPAVQRKHTDRFTNLMALQGRSCTRAVHGRRPA